MELDDSFVSKYIVFSQTLSDITWCNSGSTEPCNNTRSKNFSEPTLAKHFRKYSKTMSIKIVLAN